MAQERRNTIEMFLTRSFVSLSRQNMYKVMADKGILPKTDKEPLNVGFTCMVGLTSPLDPEKYPELKDDVAHFRSVIGGERHNVWMDLYYSSVSTDVLCIPN